MRCVPATDNVIPFRRPAGLPPSPSAQAAGWAGEWAGEWAGREAFAPAPARTRSRADQRSLMDAVYATGTLTVAAADRETKLIASRLQVYGFLTIEEVGEDRTLRRLRPSEAIRARAERPWLLSKASYAAGLPVTIPAADDFLFEPADRPA